MQWLNGRKNIKNNMLNRFNHPQTFKNDLLKETVRSGSIAAIAMIPFGITFFLLDMRVNEYGMKVIQTFFGNLPQGLRFVLFVAEHFLISWTAALPLLLILLWAEHRYAALLVGAAYGGVFYVAINSFTLPWIFGDQTPWALGFSFVLPSLVVHLVYGLSIAFTSMAFRQRHALK